MMVKSKRFLVVMLAALLSGCAMMPQKGTEAPLLLSSSSFNDLSGWTDDDASAALPALARSCARLVKIKGASDMSRHAFAGSASAWQDVCARLPSGAIDAAAARQFFEDNFTPYRLWSGNAGTGLFTGYYEPRLKAAEQGGTPLYARPDDLVTVDLGAFKPELKGETIAGRVEKGALIPYFDRADIMKGKLEGRAEVIARAEDPVDAFFLQVQGSGQVTGQDGKTLHVGYAAQNGQPYFAIGKALVERGYLQKENVSMQSIAAFLRDHPDQRDEILNLNKSYVFFRKIGEDGPLGAEGTALTPGRSLAVDFRQLPYGAPVFIDADFPQAEKDAKQNERLQRLLIAQDTGGAIRGAIRGDVFWGAGDGAAARAGVMKSQGRAWILLPKNVALPDSMMKKSFLGFSS